MFPRLESKRMMIRKQVHNDTCQRVRNQLFQKEPIEYNLCSFNLLFYQTKDKECLLKDLKKPLDTNNLLEWVLERHINSKEQANNFDQLQNYIDLYPYSESSLLVGYAGLFSLQLKKIRKARQYLEKSIQLYPNNYFVSLLIDFLIQEKDYEGVEKILLGLPRDVYVNRHLLNLYKLDSEELWVPVALKSIKDDPLCDFQILLDVKPHVSAYQYVDLLAIRIEFNQTEENVWIELINSLDNTLYLNTNIRPSETSLLWDERLQWWPKYLDRHSNVIYKRVWYQFHRIPLGD